MTTQQNLHGKNHSSLCKTSIRKFSLSLFRATTLILRGLAGYKIFKYFDTVDMALNNTYLHLLFSQKEHD